MLVKIVRIFEYLYKEPKMGNEYSKIDIEFNRVKSGIIGEVHPKIHENDIP